MTLKFISNSSPSGCKHSHTKNRWETVCQGQSGRRSSSKSRPVEYCTLPNRGIKSITITIFTTCPWLVSMIFEFNNNSQSSCSGSPPRIYQEAACHCRRSRGTLPNRGIKSRYCNKNGSSISNNNGSRNILLDKTLLTPRYNRNL